ncbi:hypothetical protein HYPSUDRAFT_203645 [Hypholoma sublateritium FD-334 SS-4]|uniref:Uncharacterized protein n=1 Tax=Hypholoma sublateritium (strain FD-334 SS-4) TaxID=945553 RepID=A0A0D2NW00_HYPSF|nr:hypothetical protein HYPSUDRAFT_203645 [Hypholoma sublateritium FD-334 SS-4]
MLPLASPHPASTYIPSPAAPPSPLLVYPIPMPCATSSDGGMLHAPVLLFDTEYLPTPNPRIISAPIAKISLSSSPALVLALPVFLLTLNFATSSDYAVLVSAPLGHCWSDEFQVPPSRPPAFFLLCWPPLVEMGGYRPATATSLCVPSPRYYRPPFPLSPISPQSALLCALSVHR